jgi:hypothetical protein
MREGNSNSLKRGCESRHHASGPSQQALWQTDIKNFQFQPEMSQFVSAPPRAPAFCLLAVPATTSPTRVAIPVADVDASQAKALWSKLVFTGKATMPKEVGSSAEVKKAVAANPKAMGYIESGGAGLPAGSDICTFVGPDSDLARKKCSLSHHAGCRGHAGIHWDRTKQHNNEATQ